MNKNKNKPHKGLLKRVRITGTGKVRHRSAYHKHLSSHKSGKRLRQLRNDPYVADSESNRFEAMLFRRLRGRNQPMSALKRSPSPTERHEARQAKIDQMKEHNPEMYARLTPSA